jgi:very-short-patch-repair endonuclease
MLIEVAPSATTKELDHFITMAARKRILDINAVEDAFKRHARRPGVAKAREAFAAYRPRPDRKSDLEREFDQELDNHPDIPKPQTNVFLLGRFEADCYWPEHNLVVELDGRPYHTAARDIDKDAYKDGQLLRAHIRTLRIKDIRWQLDRAGCMEDVRSLLGLPPMAGDAVAPGRLTSAVAQPPATAGALWLPAA